MKLEPIIEMRCMVSALWKRFCVHVFEGRLTLEDMDRIEVDSEAWHKRVPGKLVEMVVIRPSNAKMTTEERTRMARLIKRYENVRIASATVILGRGLVGAMQRSVLTGLQMIVPAPHPTKVFAEIDEATAWLSPHVQQVCGSEATGDALTVAVHALCEEFAARRS